MTAGPSHPLPRRDWRNGQSLVGRRDFTAVDDLAPRFGRSLPHGPKWPSGSRFIGERLGERRVVIDPEAQASSQVKAYLERSTQAGKALQPRSIVSLKGLHTDPR